MIAVNLLPFGLVNMLYWVELHNNLILIKIFLKNLQKL